MHRAVSGSGSQAWLGGLLSGDLLVQQFSKGVQRPWQAAGVARNILNKILHAGTVTPGVQYERR